MINELMKRLSKLPNVTLSDGQEYIQLYDAMETVKRALEQEPIVRCGQCKFAEVADSEDSQDGYTCQFHRGSIWFGGSYCSWAERRQDG